MLLPGPQCPPEGSSGCSPHEVGHSMPSPSLQMPLAQVQTQPDTRMETPQASVPLSQHSSPVLVGKAEGGFGSSISGTDTELSAGMLAGSQWE